VVPNVGGIPPRAGGMGIARLSVMKVFDKSNLVNFKQQK